MCPDPADIEDLAAVLRRRRGELGLSQNDLAGALNHLGQPTITNTEVARWERGKRIPRAAARRLLETALGLPVLTLDASAAAQRQGRSPTVVGAIRIDQTALAVDGVRAALIGASGLFDLPDGPGASANEVQRRLDAVMKDYQAGKLQQALAAIPSLIEDADLLCSFKSDAAHERLMAFGCQSAAMILTKAGETDLAWVAAEKGRAASIRSGDISAAASLQRSVVHTLQSLGQNGLASRMADRSASDLKSELDERNASAVSLYGTLLLASSMVAARQQDSTAVDEILDEAEYLAGRLPGDRNHLWTAFGPTNVAMHRVSTAVALDDVAKAEKCSRAIDGQALPAERYARHLFDRATIELRRDRTGSAVRSLLNASKAAPEYVREHRMAQQIVGQLRTSPEARSDERVAALDRRVAVGSTG